MLRLRSAAHFVVLVGLLATGSLARAIPIAGWMHYEQRLLSRQLDTSRILAPRSKQDPKFAPERGRTFAVKTYWVDAAKLDAFEGQGLTAPLRTLFFRTTPTGAQARLLVHPESARFYAKLLAGAERAEDFQASATASSRTLLVWPKSAPGEAFFAKLSLDKEVGGTRRTIPRGEVARSIGVNDILHADGKTLPKTFKFLPEVIGMMPKGMPRGGMIIRAIPDEAKDGRADYVPLFSLYARPKGGGPPLLAELIAKSGLSAERFIEQRLLRPFAKQWLALAATRGIVMEAHAQNMLVELGADGLPTGTFVHRDFGGFNVDLAFRKRGGLPTPSRLPVLDSLVEDYHQKHHVTAIDQSLHTYFSGGFLYNLDQAIPEWKKRGWVTTAAARPLRMDDLFAEALRGEHVALLGKAAPIGADLQLSGVIKQARASYGQ